MKILQNYNLAKHNTFGIEAVAKMYVEINSLKEMKELFLTPEFTNNKRMFLGGGSNVLLLKDFDGVVIYNKLKEITILHEDEESVLIHSLSGVVWQDLVIFAVGRGYWGIENLSLIPGTVGAAPMQNIGAYGAELRSVLESVEAYDIETGEGRIFTMEECALGYRDSIFKSRLKDKYFIYAITIKLSKNEQKNIRYRILSDYLENNKIEVKSPKDISDAVSEIRRSKLPDPKVIGNAGSFFKNVFLSKEKEKEKIKDLLQNNPQMPYFDEGEFIKIPTAWLIEQSGWKGRTVGNAGVHDKQALVLVNHGGATGEEVLHVAHQIIEDIRTKFGLVIVPEVNIV